MPPRHARCYSHMLRGVTVHALLFALLANLLLPVAAPPGAVAASRPTAHPSRSALRSTRSTSASAPRTIYLNEQLGQGLKSLGIDRQIAAGYAGVRAAGAGAAQQLQQEGQQLWRGLGVLLAPPVAPAPQRVSVSPAPLRQTAMPSFSTAIDLGNVKIWYNDVVGQQSIIGLVGIGSASQSEPYYLADGATWNSTGPISLTGDLRTSTTSLVRGDFTVDRDSGVVTPQGGVVGLLQKIGNSNVSIVPQVSINVLSPEIQVTSDLNLALPENNTVGGQINYKLNVNGTITDTSSLSLNLTLAGATLQSDLFVTNNGLEAGLAKLRVPGIDTDIELHDLVIDGNGELGLHFGADVSFPVPDIDLGGGVLMLEGLRATLKLNAGKYEIAFSQGSLQVSKLPENSGLSASLKTVTVAAGKVAGSVSDLNLTVAGLTLALSNASLDLQGGAHVLKAATAKLSIPRSWSAADPTIDLQSVTIKNSAPYLDIGGGGLSFSTAKSFSFNGGSANVTFDQISGSLQDQSSKWTVSLSSRLTFTFGASGKDSAVAQGTTLTIDGGNVSAQIADLTLKLASMDLQIDSLAYSDDHFTAASAELTLPGVWQGASVTVDGLQIDRSGLKLGGADGQFSIPDQSFGKVLTLSHMTAALKLDLSDSDYTVAITASVEIASPTPGTADLSVVGKLAIDDGSVSGGLEDFSFLLSGLTFNARDVMFQDDTVYVGAAAIVLPKTISGDSDTGTDQPKCPPDGSGSPGAVVCSLQIGAAGFSLGGAQIKLPDFTVAHIGVTNVTAFISHNTTTDSYTFGGSADFEFEKFSVEGSFSFDYQPSTSSLQLDQVAFSFQGSVPEPSIPLGVTGFALTGVSGSVDLTDGNTTIELGIVASSELFVGSTPLLNLSGTVTLKLNPAFDLSAGLDAALLGYPLASVQLNINDQAFTLNGQLGTDIANISLSLAFGQASVERCGWSNGSYSCQSAQEQTFFGSANLNVTIPRGYFFNEWYAPDIPPFDISVNGSFEAGKFTSSSGEIWGAQGTLSAYGFDVDGSATFSPNFQVSLGQQLTGYTPELPAVNSLGVLATGVAQRTVNFTKPHRYLLVAEAITNTNRTAAPLFTALSPSGKLVTARLAFPDTNKAGEKAYDGRLRLYHIPLDQPEDAVGHWTFTFRSGNLIQVKGANARPRLQSATLCVLSACQAPGAALTLNDGQALTLNWDAKGYSNGLTVQAFAENRQHQRYTIVHQTVRDASVLKGTKTWQPLLPSGVYTLTMLLDPHDGAPVRKHLGLLQINDTVGPAAPAALQADLLPERAVRLSWTPTANSDIAGYLITVDGKTPLKIGRVISSRIVHGLTPGHTHTLSVTAYDLSGNRGATAAVTVTLPRFSVEALWPARARSTRAVREIGISFNAPVSQLVFSVTDAEGRPVLGQLQPIAHRHAGKAVTLGAVFKPTGGTLRGGTYTVQVSALNEATQASSTTSWSFTVGPARGLLYLPVVRRSAR